MSKAGQLKSHKLGFIYELYGLKNDAEYIYASILKDVPDDRLARDCLHRLRTKSHFIKANKKQKERFVHLASKDEADEFQRWLKQWN